MVSTVRGSRGKSGKNQRIGESQGIYKYQGAKVNKDAEKKFELKIFPACFAHRLFVFPFFEFIPLSLFLV